MIDFTRIRALVIDIDGTLWRGHSPLPGVEQLFDFLNRQQISFVVATNNTTEAPQKYWKRLLELGVTIRCEQILTAAVATADYLRDNFAPGAPIYLIGQPALLTLIEQAGFVTVSSARLPATAVVVGGDHDLTYDKLKNAVLHLQRGAVFIGTNPDLLIPTEEGLVPEAGTTLAALQAATGLQPTVIGKPERHLFELALRRMGSQPAQTAMLGDRLITDILGAQRAGIASILVTTGVDSTGTISEQEIQPDVVVNGLTELVSLWRQQL
jgi:4-nitrophenyl phosphatase